MGSKKTAFRNAGLTKVVKQPCKNTLIIARYIREEPRNMTQILEYGKQHGISHSAIRQIISALTSRTELGLLYEENGVVGYLPDTFLKG